MSAHVDGGTGRDSVIAPVVAAASVGAAEAVVAGLWEAPVPPASTSASIATREVIAGRPPPASRNTAAPRAYAPSMPNKMPRHWLLRKRPLLRLEPKRSSAESQRVILDCLCACCDASMQA